MVNSSVIIPSSREKGSQPIRVQLQLLRAQNSQMKSYITVNTRDDDRGRHDEREVREISMGTPGVTTQGC